MSRYPDSSDSSFSLMKVAVAAVAVIVGVIFLLALFGSHVQIEAGNVGVMANWGAIDKNQQPLAQGWHWLTPFGGQSVTVVSTQPQNHRFSEVAAASRELQNVYVDGGVNYHIDASQAPEIVTEGGLDAVVRKVFDPAFQDYIKETVPHFGAQEVLAQRVAIRNATLEALRTKATTYGIHVDDLFITNIRFEPSYTKAIEQAAEAQQLKVKAQNEAAAKVTAAQGDADANRLRNITLTPEYLEYLKLQNDKAAIDKWKGDVPQVTSGAAPFINIGGPTPAK